MAHAENIGGLIKVVAGSAPVDTAAATITGLAYDRTGYRSAVVFVKLGAASGTPDSFTVACKVQHSTDDGSTDAYADYKPDGTNVAAITTLTADLASGYVDVNLSGAKAYIKLVPVVTFVGGTSPKIEVATTIVLGGAVEPPVA